ncbi:hypothetical protein A3G50_01480 [Candidatus Jorgensenbacteria bacterium RIFCSPLOWO2_12_FULL_42_11]|uniref:Uncharacterized protein n=2 Tax=Parcubacteria group TaxID=1794811 RepID=A0A1F6C2N0_9BACT|nr:MAG: hypothetical protein A3G50_01480 [Candidatus Jorgensenbacteria bacterium RIFCSPLOWO2_12_FULL_42_11]OGZ31683.1 MAG: hypothetical protein A3J00_02925 [Candidatus Niyogibacteria bacterium RIFCSPLOWO2_02_FULL_45_13]
MTPRLVKQLLYGAFYLLIIIIIFWLVYILFLKPAPTCFDKIKNQGETGTDCGKPCSPCEIARLKPLMVNWAVSVPARENEISLLAEITNSNPNFGAQAFSYQFTIFGPFGALLKTVKGQSFIYTGEKKYLIEPPLKINPQDVSRVELSIEKESVVWQSEKELVKPKLSARSVRTNIADKNITVNGLLKNEYPLLISQVKIITILYNRQNRVSNASFTTLTDLKGFEERFFGVELPKDENVNQLDLNQVKIFIEPRP